MTDAKTAAKREAAELAAAMVESGMVLGLGSGSTAAFAVDAIGRRLEAGEIEDIVGIPTSTATRERATALGIPLTTLEERPNIDLTIDGADEVDPDGNMIKGGGGALLWEKIVAKQTDRYVIVVDEAKLVPRLGETFALPVEVVRFGWKTHFAAIFQLGAEPTLRRKEGAPFTTDEGHYIIDCRFPHGIGDVDAAEVALTERAGVVVTGLFLDFRPRVIVGRARKR